MVDHLEVLIEHQQKNVSKIELINQGIIGKGVEGWYIINEVLKGVIPDEIYNQAIRLNKQREELLLECQREAFNSHKDVCKLNEEYGLIFVEYDFSKGFVDNCRAKFKPFPDQDGPVLQLHPGVEDEIARDAIRRYESNQLISILSELNVLYEQAIEFLKKSKRALGD